jgi:hypothetical protein
MAQQSLEEIKIEVLQRSTFEGRREEGGRRREEGGGRREEEGSRINHHEQ